MKPAESKVILEVSDLCVDYASSSGTAKAVDQVSFELSEGEFLAVVGESGCGKSTLLFAIARLLSPPAEVSGGKVVFSGQNMVAMSDKALRALRWRNLSVVMQSAMNALNPVSSIRAQFFDAMKAHGETDPESRPGTLGGGPLDGGHRSRPPVQLCAPALRGDAPAGHDRHGSALLAGADLDGRAHLGLDVVAQRSLMVQIKQLQAELGFAIIFVTHDMSLVSHFSDRVAVMYAGQVVETRPTRPLFDNPLHPYTRGLLDSFPSVYGPKVLVEGIPGSPPDLTSLPAGCNFSPRCPKVTPRCSAAEPGLYEVEDALVRCVLYEGWEWGTCLKPSGYLRMLHPSLCSPTSCWRPGG